jgi:hypothetical protein
MDLKIQNEINRLSNIRNTLQNAYIEDVEVLKLQLQKNTRQFETCTTNTKLFILQKQRCNYKKEIKQLDKTTEVKMRYYENKISSLKIKLQNIQMYKQTFENNINTLRYKIKNENGDDIFTMFEHVTDALEILMKEKTENE